MGTNFKTIYQRFLSKVRDFTFFDLTEQESLDFCRSLMLSALPKLQNLEHDLNDYNEDLNAFNVILNNTELEYIATAMAAEWVEPQLNTTVLLRFYVGTKDEKFFAPANQIAQLRNLRDDWIMRTKKIHRDYTFRNSDYFQ